MSVDAEHLSTCPAEVQLMAFSLGAIVEPEFEQVASHVAHCGGCGDRLWRIARQPDALISTLREIDFLTPISEEPECALLKEAAKAIRIDRIEADQLANERRERCDPTSFPRGFTATSLGGYQLLERLGYGGMGVVYKALHSRLKRTVAIKILSNSRVGDPSAVDRFFREWEAIGRLEHPNIVRATDAGEADGLHFLAMEYVDGVDLARLVQHVGPLATAHACELVRQAAIGLQYVDEQGLVHRDIKPSNLMVSRAGGLKILDLGLALLNDNRPAGENGLAEGGLTSRNQIVGTADYMAPEQIVDSHNVDIRADIYSLGCSLYHLLAGVPPFNGPNYDSPFRKLMGHTQGRLPSISALRPDLPDELVAFIDILLSRDRGRRPGNPGDVASALATFASAEGLIAVVERACSCGNELALEMPSDGRFPRHDRPDQDGRRPDRGDPANDRALNGSRLLSRRAFAGLGAAVVLAVSGFATYTLSERPAAKQSWSSPALGGGGFVGGTPVLNRRTWSSPTLGGEGFGSNSPVVPPLQSEGGAADPVSRYLQPPETLLWPAQSTGFSNYESSQRLLNVTCDGMALFEFDKAETDDYEFEATIQQIVDVGRVGIFFGYHVDRRHPDVSVHFQLIETIRGDSGKFAVQRSRITLTNGAVSREDIIGTGPVRNQSPTAPHVLRLYVKGGMLRRVLWDGVDVDGLATRNPSGFLAAGDGLGPCGTFNDRSNSAFRNVMLVLPAER